jgi:class 3 adenylate cyclase
LGLRRKIGERALPRDRAERIGYECRNDYMAIGSVVNLASRLCDVALDGQVLLDSDTASGLSGEFALEAPGDRELKGLGDKTAVYAVLPKAVVSAFAWREKAGMDPQSIAYLVACIY